MVLRRLSPAIRLTNRPTVPMLSDGPWGSNDNARATTMDAAAVRATLDGPLGTWTKSS